MKKCYNGVKAVIPQMNNVVRFIKNSLVWMHISGIGLYKYFNMGSLVSIKPNIRYQKHKRGEKDGKKHKKNNVTHMLIKIFAKSVDEQLR